MFLIDYDVGVQVTARDIVGWDALDLALAVNSLVHGLGNEVGLGGEVLLGLHLQVVAVGRDEALVVGVTLVH